MPIEIKEVREAVDHALKTVQEEHTKSSKEMKETIDRGLAEIKQFGSLTTETNAKLTEFGEKTVGLQSKLHEIQQQVDTLKAAGAGTATPQQVKTLGQIVAESDQWQASKKANSKTMQAVEIGSFHRKAIVNAIGQNQPLVMSQRMPDIIAPGNQLLTIRDLLPIGRASGNLIEFVRENVFTNSAGVVYSSPAYENVTKPESNLTFTLLNAAVVTIAHWLAASRQVLSDAPMLQSYIDNRLTFGLKLKEEDQILNGDGTAGNIDGLMHQATAYAGAGAVSGDQQLDTLLRAITQVFTGSQFMADGITLNPIDWTKIRLLKDTQGRYLFGNPNDNQTPSAWGMPLVQSQSIAQTRFLVGAFKLGAQLWDREDADVRIAEQHADFFVKNMVVMLAEERLALTVFRPLAFVRGNFN